MFDTLDLPTTVALTRKRATPGHSSMGTPLPRLTGRYEVIVPKSNGTIFFTDSLEEAARHVAIAHGNSGITSEVYDYLLGVEELGFLRAGQYGTRIHRPLDDNSSWSAKVRGMQPRPAPRYAIGDTVEVIPNAKDLPAHLYGGRQVRIYGVVVLNDVRAGKQYGYTLDNGGGQRVSEDRLRPVNEATGRLDFDQLSA